MKNKVVVQIIICFCIPWLGVISSCDNENNIESKAECKEIDSTGIIHLVNFDKAREKIVVFDEVVANQIATVVLSSKYGIDNVWAQKPFEIELIQDSFWVVRGVLPINTPGGVAHIKIRKDDGAILGVAHTK
ncbi:MAG: hypothetical protein ACI837_001889 [Crocinitomicaceae bacterium]|jgi:hypothetical protein